MKLKISDFVFFSPEAGDTDWNFVDVMGRKSKDTQYQKQNKQKKNAGKTVCCRVSVVYPQNHVADWELELSAAAQHLERVLYGVSVAWENIQIQNSKYGLC